MTDSPPLPAPDGTRLALLNAGLHLFGHQGFAATSTREIAALAGTNVASIAYHFDGKDGLRLGCAQEFARRVSAVMMQDSPPPATPDLARAALKAALRRMVGFMVGSSDAAELVPFMLREINEDGPSVDLIYAALMEPAHRRFCALWALATGQEPESDAIKLTVFSMIGQVLYFRIGARVIARRMGWAQFSAPQVEAIAAQLLQNLEAVLAASKEV